MFGLLDRCSTPWRLYWQVALIIGERSKGILFYSSSIITQGDGFSVYSLPA